MEADASASAHSYGLRDDEIATLRSDVARLREDMARYIESCLAAFHREVEMQLSDLRRCVGGAEGGADASPTGRGALDWRHATTNSLGERLHHLERTHGAKLDSLDARVGRLERRRR